MSALKEIQTPGGASGRPGTGRVSSEHAAPAAPAAARRQNRTAGSILADGLPAARCAPGAPEPPVLSSTVTVNAAAREST